MKKQLTIFTTSILSILTLPTVLAKCTINGEIVPCEVFWNKFSWMFGLLGVFILISTFFWIWMLIDCLKREFKDKIIWVILLVFTGILGAILYYFLIKRKEDKK